MIPHSGCDCWIADITKNGKILNGGFPPEGAVSGVEADLLPATQGQRQGLASCGSKGILPLDQVVNQDLRRNFDFGALPKFLLPDERVHFFGLPGHGVALFDCGFFFMKGCLNTLEHPDGLAVFKPSVHRCFSPKCPICWPFWAKREAARIEDRILAAMRLNPSLGRPIHVVASVPRRLYSLSLFDEREWVISRHGKPYSKIVRKGLRSFAQRIVKKAGFRGGVIIFHPFRQNSSTHLWYFSPHFHLIGFGWIENSSDIFKDSGWIVKNLGVRNNVFGTAFYQLTHCGIWYSVGRRHNVVWFGDLSYQALKVPKSLSKGCPYCGRKLESLAREPGFSMPLPCSGIGGIYLASADGWVTCSSLYLAARIPTDMNFKYPSRTVDLVSLDLLLG